MKYDYDVIIIGSGPAGFSCAMQSSKFDKKVLVVEASEDTFGGTWINSGTIPSKALRETARIIQRFQNQFEDLAKEKAYEHHQMADLLLYKNKILRSKNDKIENDFRKNEIDTIRGFGKIKDDHTVAVETSEGETKEFTTEFVMLSTGSKPIKPKGFKVDHDKIMDYTSVLSLSHIPRRLVVIGSGVRALEYATTFSNLGSRVSILNEYDSFLPFLDHEITDQLKTVLEKQKIEVFSNAEKIEIKQNTLRNTTEVKYQLRNDKENGRAHVIETEHVLYLGGKQPNTENLGLKNVGVNTDKEGYVKVDEDFKTSVSHLYAGGDVIGYPAMASSSFSEGRIASCHMFGIEADNVTTDIPFAIYSIPEIADIGLTEQEARERNLDVTVGRAYYQNITQGDISKQEDGLLKLVFETDTLKLLGIHIIGERASDLIHLGQSVMAFGGDIRYFINHVLNYPTYSEAYRIAAFNGMNRVYKAGVKYKKILKKS
ncbi:Si-specific NAD(P)(+) transhydrogenase [Gracilimonas mengyeensis]|uniref:Soluble pyridine nucleotide transhydrogenase n=1 Tax=Gracilimonas mengyeensis TaxID=1302730 RepID=A0A521F7S6_9BACT|nr:Si-specific NAD(P)(+) transhydrogenase [Gracilimonas mengyeensis]SMO91590.1 NAD(P) transhydrogenase [Gracilimonas mengyeensis]